MTILVLSLFFSSWMSQYGGMFCKSINFLDLPVYAWHELNFFVCLSNRFMSHFLVCPSFFLCHHVIFRKSVLQKLQNQYILFYGGGRSNFNFFLLLLFPPKGIKLRPMYSRERKKEEHEIYLFLCIIDTIPILREL